MGGTAGLSALLITAAPGFAMAVAAVLGVLALVAMGDLATALRRRPTVSCRLPAALHAGERAALTIELTPSWAGASAAVDWPLGLDGPADAPLLGDAACTDLPVTARRRGRWDIAQLWLKLPSPLGLFDLVPRVTPKLTTDVTPDIRSVRSGEIAMQVRSALFGMKQTSAVGEGAEFHQLRDFMPGMDPRSIDWKHSARHRTLLAKETQAERNHQIILGIDCGRLMGVELAGLPKLDHAINAALALGWAATVAGDKLGLYAYDLRPRLYLPPRAGRGAFARLRAETAALGYAEDESNHALALSDLKLRTPRRSLIVIFSDFVDPTTAELLVEYLGALAMRHLVLFVAVSDDEIARQATARPDDLQHMALAVAAGRAMAERAEVLGRLTRSGVQVIDAPRGRAAPALISAYLALKMGDSL